jgi:DNA-binding transcriptional ArsR family regulator
VVAVTSAFGDPTRRQIYLFAREHDDGVTAGEVAERFALHPNVARHHLDKLAAGGYLEVSASRGQQGGAGRPSKRYRISGPAAGLEVPLRGDDLMITLLGRALALLPPAEAEAMAVAEALLRRLSFDDGMELWVAEVDGQIVSAGRLEPVTGTDFAGIWGGATRQEWRGRGIYRALTAARARSALRKGKTLITSDSTEYSRPILERSGLVKVSTTTPYQWQR